MHKLFEKVIEKFKQFNKKDWITFSIGFFLLITYIVITMNEWKMVSYRAVADYSKIQDIIAKLPINEQKHFSDIVYPNANRLFWGGSTYWFTFLSNIFMAITLLFYPTAQNSLRAQKFYFASMVYIIIVASAYWTGVFMVPTTYTNLFYDQKVKSIIMHIVAPILGLATLYYERKRIQISNPSIWSFAIYPALYLILLIVPTYVLGYKFMEFGKTTQADGTIIYPSELSRGIVIYQLVSFNHPLGYPGDLIFIKVVLNILMISLAFISAPAIGFLLRQILRIRRPGQEEMPKLYFINPDTKYIKAMLKFTNRLSKYSLESANEIRERLFPKKDSNKKIQNYYQKAMETIQKLSKNKNKETNENNDMN